MTRFYCKTIKPGSVQIDGAEAHHLMHVMRLAVGETVELFDGKGTLADATITELKRKDVLLQAENVRKTPPRTSGRIIIASSIAKGQHFDDIINKCTQLGADHIAPVLFERTVKQAANKSALDRYSKIAITAAKQSHGIFLPELTAPASLKQTITALKDAYPSALMVFGGLTEDAESITALPSDDRDIIAFIGPEGGMTQAEEKLLLDNRAKPIRLTETILRIETAAVTFAAILCTIRDSQAQ